MSCPVRFPILHPGDAVKIVEGLGLSSPPKYLTCDLEAGHEGRHHDPSIGFWEFVGFAGLGIPELSHPHQNCKCQLAEVDSSTRLPAWWVAQALEDMVGPTPPRLFFELER